MPIADKTPYSKEYIANRGFNKQYQVPFKAIALEDADNPGEFMLMQGGINASGQFGIASYFPNVGIDATYPDNNTMVLSRTVNGVNQEKTITFDNGRLANATSWIEV
jgi:hypothetical protein